MHDLLLTIACHLQPGAFRDPVSYPWRICTIRLRSNRVFQWHDSIDHTRRLGREFHNTSWARPSIETIENALKKIYISLSGASPRPVPLVTGKTSFLRHHWTRAVLVPSRRLCVFDPKQRYIVHWLSLPAVYFRKQAARSVTTSFRVSGTGDTGWQMAM